MMQSKNKLLASFPVWRIIALRMFNWRFSVEVYSYSSADRYQLFYVFLSRYSNNWRSLFRGAINLQPQVLNTHSGFPDANLLPWSVLALSVAMTPVVRPRNARVEQYFETLSGTACYSNSIPMDLYTSWTSPADWKPSHKCRGVQASWISWGRKMFQWETSKVLERKLPKRTCARGVSWLWRHDFGYS